MKGLFEKLRIGQQKEQQAQRWLEEQGFSIIASNYHCKGGEIDIIASLPQSLVFFEVKYRKSTAYGHPAEMVNASKQQHIIHCAQIFLNKHPQYQNFSMQFDVLTFTDQQTEPDWIQNAFQVD